MVIIHKADAWFQPTKGKREAFYYTKVHELVRALPNVIVGTDSAGRELQVSKEGKVDQSSTESRHEGERKQQCSFLYAADFSSWQNET